MAEEKDFMASQDFLGDLMKNVGKSTGGGLFEKLSTNARQEALQPLTKLANIKSFTQPFIELKNKAETAQKAGLAAYIAANPDIDESLLYDGTGDIVNNVMQQNNLRFREINKQLSFMDIRNPKYQELANELNKINSTSAQLREDNTKLLGIRNVMREQNKVEELTKGMSEPMLNMYTDIQTGNKANFVNVNGKLHWQDPKNVDAEPVAISKLSAAGPTYTNSTVMTKHAELYDNVIKSQFVDDAQLHTKIMNIWNMSGVKEAGLKSFIFDNQDADILMGFNTSDWFDSWYKDQGIETEEAKEAEYERIRNGGVLIDGAFTKESGKKGDVKQHFSAWYHGKLKENVASQFNKIQATKDKSAILNVPLDPDPDPETPITRDGAIVDAFKADDTDAVKILERNRDTIGVPKGIKFDDTIFDFSEVVKLDDSDELGIFELLPKEYSNFLTEQTDEAANINTGEQIQRFDRTMKVYNMLIERKVNAEDAASEFLKLYKELYG